jgi:glycine/D-amino acid oxidase-like deaminating enzyme
MTPRYDAIVVGAGLGGLTAAALLALAGGCWCWNGTQGWGARRRCTAMAH